MKPTARSKRANADCDEPTSQLALRMEKVRPQVIRSATFPFFWWKKWPPLAVAQQRTPHKKNA
jgi:hypothetical protein